MRNRRVLPFIVWALLFPLAHGISADYMLPYPGYMPGHTLYRVSRAIDVFKRYWSYGNIGSFRYHLSLADKYLVEAKTLFEYKQYRLAVDALSRSDKEFRLVPECLGRMYGQGIDVSLFREQLARARAKHTEVLMVLLGALPESIEWKPEKLPATVLPISGILKQSIAARADPYQK